MSPTPILRTQGLALHAGRCLVQGLDWQVLPGQRWCLMGRNASGKTSLLRALAGLSVPRCEGQVWWQERPQAAWAADQAARFRAYAPQQSSDRFAISVGRLLALSREGLDTPEQAGLLSDLHLADLRQRPVQALSAGERQRVALAQCALQGAPLLLMDEPVSFQDPAQQVAVARWLQARVPLHSPRALVCSAHDVNWIARVASHVLALDGQGGWFAGPLAEVLTAPRLRQIYGCDWQRQGDTWVAG